MTRSEFLTSSSPRVLFPESFKFVPALAPNVAPASIPDNLVPVPDSKLLRSDKPTVDLSIDIESIRVEPFLICISWLFLAITRSEFLTSASFKVLLPESFRFVPAVAPRVAPASIPDNFVPVPASKESRSDRPTLALLKV